MSVLPVNVGWGDFEGFSEEPGKIEYLSVITPTSKVVAEGKIDEDGNPYQVGEFLLGEDHGVGIEFAFVAPPQLTRALNEKALKDDGDFAKRVCNSNDGVRPVASAVVMTDPRTGATAITDLGLPVGVITQNGQVGGCAVCPLSQWATVAAGKKAPLCKESDAYPLFVTGMWVAKSGAKFGNLGAVKYYRENGPVASHFELRPINRLAVLTARSYTMESLRKGFYKFNNEKHEVTPVKSLMVPFVLTSTKPDNVLPEVWDSLQAFHGFPRKLTIVTDGEMTYTLEQAVNAKAAVTLAGYHTVRTTATTHPAVSNNMQPSTVIHFVAPTADSPILMVDEEAFDKYEEYRAMVVDGDVIELLGWQRTLGTAVTAAPHYLSSGAEEIPGFESTALPPGNPDADADAAFGSLLAPPTLKNPF